jgi:hypothetical protein
MIKGLTQKVLVATLCVLSISCTSPNSSEKNKTLYEKIILQPLQCSQTPWKHHYENYQEKYPKHLQNIDLSKTPVNKEAAIIKWYYQNPDPESDSIFYPNLKEGRKKIEISETLGEQIGYYPNYNPGIFTMCGSKTQEAWKILICKEDAKNLLDLGISYNAQQTPAIEISQEN